jgi:hypothetical protein
MLSFPSILISEASMLIIHSVQPYGTDIMYCYQACLHMHCLAMVPYCCAFMC